MKENLIERLKTNKVLDNSWVDLFFTRDIHIIGLRLDFIEIDLWWLLTYWADQIIKKNNSNIKNKIYYYIPQKHTGKANGKIELLGNLGVEVIIVKKSYYQYYNYILDYFEGKISKATLKK